MLDIIIAILCVALTCLVWVMLYDSNRFVVVQHQAVDERIRKKARAVVLSDLHNKSYGRNNEKLLAAIRQQDPDFVLIAGDILTARPGESFAPAVQFLQELGEAYAKELSGMGIQPLVNSHVLLAEYGIAVYGLEMDKFYYKRFRIPSMAPAYLEGILGEPMGGYYNILLAHNPDFFPRYAAWGADLVLSGHVHGGVARVPFWGKGIISPGYRLFPRYDGGIFREGKSVMVLSRGLGMHTIPVRLFNPGELWVVDFDRP